MADALVVPAQLADTEGLNFESHEYDVRYYIHTAKNSIQGLAHVIGEVVSNADEAITKGARRDGRADVGEIHIYYDPEDMFLTVTDDGVGMTSTEMRDRLKKIGAGPQVDARRGFFHRGIREVFLAMGGGVIISVGRTPSGDVETSRAVFDPKRGMALTEGESEATRLAGELLGEGRTGTIVRIPMKRFASAKPKLFEFGMVDYQIRNCVQIRPVLLDPSRNAFLHYGKEAPRRLAYEYEAGEVLIAEKTVEVAGHTATIWVKAAPDAITSHTSKQTRRNGILVRGERAAYEVTLGNKLKTNPAMSRVFGELRLDAIEELQREADARADEEAQLIYKADRSGLNAEHPLVESIYEFIDSTVGPVVATLEAPGAKKAVSPDMRRQLQKLAHLINKVVEDDRSGTIEDQDGQTRDEPEKPDREGEPPPPPPPPPQPPEVEDGIAFAYERIFVPAGESRAVKVWFDTDKIPPGTKVSRTSKPDEIVHAALLSAAEVPDPSSGRISELKLMITGGASEGRHEVAIESGGYRAVLPVHVRFQRATGFISQIIPDERDWESGSALYDPATGRVTVFVGRPEFRDAATRAAREKISDPWKSPLYRQLVVESVREAALRPAAERKAEVEWDDLPAEERQDRDAFLRLVLTEYFALDYALRSKLLSVFLDS